ncbi:hypothetical protein [Sphingobacterium detergens]|uniref:hypothetical protein n=1 Tax=Sphingobacterium detergens TaxID=1145106 RepID=UPI003AAB12CA
MSVKKTIGIIIGIGIVAVLVFGFFLYVTIKTKSTVISQYSPYKEWMGRTVILDKETVLLTEKVKRYDDKKYPYLLLDSLHPDWPYLAERIKLGDYKPVARFPAGVTLQIEKAVQFTGRLGQFYAFCFRYGELYGKKLQSGLSMGDDEYWEIYG